MTRTVKVSCLQTNPKSNFEEAIRESQDLAKLALGEGSQFIFIPEYCGGVRLDRSTLVPPVEKEDRHPFLKFCQDFAAKSGVWVMIGSISVASYGEKYFNRGYIIDRNGSIVSKYDKINLFDTEFGKDMFRESRTVTSGSSASVIETEFAKIAHTICYDIRFPIIYRTLAQNGAEILAIPSAFKKLTGRAHWHTLNRARAIETGSFVVSACQVGDIEGGGSSYGHSLIIDPWGRVLAYGGKERGIITATLKLDDVDLVRRQIPSLNYEPKFKILTFGSKTC